MSFFNDAQKDALLKSISQCMVLDMYVSILYTIVALYI